VQEEDNPGLVAECEYPINNEIKELEFKQKSKTFVVGPITYYYAGGEVEVSDQGMAVFNLELLAENTGSSDIVILHCSGAVSCNYHVWDGKTKFIFSSNNFAAGNIGINPGQTKSLNIIFGPGQGYGNYVDFEYDPSKEYFLLIEESFGSADIPLELITKTSKQISQKIEWKNHNCHHYKIHVYVKIKYQNLLQPLRKVRSYAGTAELCLDLMRS